MRNFVSDQLMEVVRTVLLILVSLALMFTMNVELSLIVCCFVPVVMASTLHVITGEKFQAADESEGRLTALVQENLTGVRVVRAFGRERYEIDRFNEKNEEFTNLWVRLGKVMGSNWGWGLFRRVPSAGHHCGRGVLCGAGRPDRRGVFGLYRLQLLMLVWPSRNLGRLLAELSKTSISSTRLFDILDAKEEENCPDPQQPPMDGDIVFDHVNFGYSQSEGGVLHDVSFVIKAGTTFGILGATGLGKSTFMPPKPALRAAP